MTKKKVSDEPIKMRPEFENLEKSKTIIKNSNEVIINGLCKIRRKFKLEKDHFKMNYYNKAIESLKMFKDWIQTVE